MVESNQMPVFNHPEINALYAYGWNFPKEKIEEIVALPRETVIADLEKVLDDGFNRYAFFKEMEYSYETHTFVIHATWLLCELKAETSLPKLLEVLRQDSERLDIWFSDIIHEMLPMNFEILAINQTKRLFDFLKEPDNDWSNRVVVSEALTIIALLHEDKYEEIIEEFKELTDFFVGHSDDSSIADAEFISSLVCNFMDIKDVALLPSAKKLYDKDLVYFGIAGTWVDYEKDFQNTEYDQKQPTQKNMLEYYTEIFDIVQKNEQKEKEWEANRPKREAEERAKREAALRNKSRPIPQKQVAKTPVVEKKKVFPTQTPRNAPCPCGSGRKYKNCHGK